MHRDLPIQS